MDRLGKVPLQMTLLLSDLPDNPGPGRWDFLLNLKIGDRLHLNITSAKCRVTVSRLGQKHNLKFEVISLINNSVYITRLS